MAPTPCVGGTGVARREHRGLSGWHRKPYVEGMNHAPLSLTHPLSGRTLLALTEALEHAFDAAAWARLGMELGMPQLADPEQRLQQSLRAGDDDYGYCVAQFVRHLEAGRPDDLRTLAARPEIRAWLDANAPGAGQALAQGGVPAAAPPGSASAGEGMDRALIDAERLLGAGDPPGAADQAHAAFRRHLSDIAARAHVAVVDGASVAQLMNALLEGHPKWSALDRHRSQVGTVLASLADAITALDAVRNAGPDAPPDRATMGEAEAALMVDLVRTLFKAVNARL